MCIMRGIIATVTATSSHSGRRSYGEDWSKGINKPLSIYIIYSRPHTHKSTARVAVPAFPSCAHTLAFGKTHATHLKRQSPHFARVSKTATKQEHKCTRAPNKKNRKIKSDPHVQIKSVWTNLGEKSCRNCSVLTVRCYLHVHTCMLIWNNETSIRITSTFSPKC